MGNYSNSYIHNLIIMNIIYPLFLLVFLTHLLYQSQLHNYIHHQLKTKTRSRVAANSLTGLIIACFSTGLAFAGLNWNILDATSHDWGWVFIAQVLVYLLSYWMLSRPAKAAMA